MIIDNRKFISVLDQTDRARYYHWCADLSLAGEDYKVNEIVCFVHDESDPLSNFVQIKKYDMGFLLILLYTEHQMLITECMDYVDTIKTDFNEIEIRTPYPSVLESKQILSRYSVTAPENPANPVYYIYSPEELTSVTGSVAASVSLFTELDKTDISQAIEEGLLDREYMNADMFVPCTNFKDVKWYILRVNGEIAGYLRAECGYANIYDIGWLYVEPRFRGHGYAACLVMYFSKDMFESHAIPHYGYAISQASARVAEKCGFMCDPVQCEYRCLKPL